MFYIIARVLQVGLKTCRVALTSSSIEFRVKYVLTCCTLRNHTVHQLTWIATRYHGIDNVISIPLNCRPVRIKVVFAVSRNSLDPKEITQILGLEPSRSYMNGDINQKSKLPRVGGLWQIDSSSLEEEEEEEDANLHFLWLCKKLANKEKLLQELQVQGYRIFLSCRFCIAHWNTRLNLTSEVLSLPANLALPVSVDIFDEQDEN